MRQLPSLNGLRAFETAGRLGSFAAAAAELNVTQTAVSRLVKALEARLGFALFSRRANALVLTDRGAALLPGLTAAFDDMARSVGRVRSLSQALTVAAGPSFAMREVGFVVTVDDDLVAVDLFEKCILVPSPLPRCLVEAVAGR